MTEIANMETGELINYEPMHPLEIEQAIRAIGERLEASVPALRDMWAKRYATERALIEARAKAVIRSNASSVTERRSEADLATMDLRRQHDDAKEILHAAEELQAALKARMFGFQNINRVQAALYNVSGGPR